MIRRLLSLLLARRARRAELAALHAEILSLRARLEVAKAREAAALSLRHR